MARLQDRVAVVTGAASGIGLAITEAFLREGAKVVAGDINEEGLRALAANHPSQNLMVQAGNIAVEADATALVDAAINHFGRIDILVNNAGVLDNFKPLHELDDKTWDRVMAVNVNAVLYTCRHAIKPMLAQGKGVIINLASVGGLFGARAGLAYTASKHAVVGMTRNIAFQYGPEGIRCVAIAPGGVATNIGSGMNDLSHAGYARSQTTFAAAIRTAEPSEIANVAVFLASDDASFVNGNISVVDGGWSAG
jgi:NAD(P)-dependent dehydrogenase (short-subunit alcohol dehydrogenase family)